MGIIMTLVVGLLIGIVAKFLTPGRDPGGFIVTALIGVAGSFVATYLGQSMGYYTVGEPAGFIASVIGSILLLAIYRMATKNRVSG